MTRVKAWLAVHRKLVVAVVGAALTLSIQVWGTSNVWVSFGVLAATSLGVYGAPNQAAPPPGAGAGGEDADAARRVVRLALRG